MNNLKAVTIIIISLTLISCSEYKPPNKELINFIANIWNMFIAVGYIFIVVSLAMKRASLLCFGFIYLFAAYISFLLFNFIFPGYDLIIGLPF